MKKDKPTGRNTDASLCRRTALIEGAHETEFQKSIIEVLRPGSMQFDWMGLSQLWGVQEAEVKGVQHKAETWV